MNKRMREITLEIEAKIKDAKTAQTNKDFDKAAELLDEVDALKAEFEVEKRLFEAEKDQAEPEAEKKVEDKKKAETTASFAKAARAGFPKDMSEGSDPDGGYTVPEDIVTKIERFRDAKFSLRTLVRVIPVKTKSGARTFKSRMTRTGFAKVGENGKFTKKQTPKFERMSYNVDKFGGYFVLSEEIAEDSDENVENLIVEDIGEEARVTDNREILAVISTFDETDFGDLHGIKTALNVTLGQTFAPTSTIVTNDSGLDYLDQLEDSNGRPLLKVNPTDTLKKMLAVGTTNVPIEIIPDADLPSEESYALTEDEAVIAGKAYYTRSGSEGAYVYAPVETPVSGSLATYYEKTVKIPFIVGDWMEAVILWDRRNITLKQTDVATVGTGDDAYNAFEQGGRLIRADMRADYKKRDVKALVRGFIAV